MPAFPPESEADVREIVREFRGVITQRDAAITPIDRAEYDRIAAGMRRRWKEWAGDDELLELAFGEPFEDEPTSGMSESATPAAVR